MVGMAVSATMPIGATAKAGGKLDYASHPYSSWRGSQLSLPATNVDTGDPGRVSLLGKLKNLLGGVGYGAGGESVYSPGKGWQVELLQNQAGTEVSGDIRQAREKHFGLALRMSF